MGFDINKMFETPSGFLRKEMGSDISNIGFSRKNPPFSRDLFRGWNHG